MNKDNIDNFNEDFLIKKAALSLVEKDNQLFDLLEKDDTIINPNQDKLDKKIYSMINEHLGKKNTKLIKQHKLKKLMLRIAVFVLVLTSGFVIPFIAVDAFREKVINFYIENFDTHASFKPKEDNDKLFMKFEANYIPSGYTEGDAFNTVDLYSLTFLNILNKMIDITLYYSESSFNIDSENCEVSNLVVNNNAAYIYRKTGFVALVFKYHGNPIVISSNDETLTNEELLKIAESIK
jgi:hypothetical protein